MTKKQSGSNDEVFIRSLKRGDFFGEKALQRYVLSNLAGSIALQRYVLSNLAGSIEPTEICIVLSDRVYKALRRYVLSYMAGSIKPYGGMYCLIWQGL